MKHLSLACFTLALAFGFSGCNPAPDVARTILKTVAAPDGKHEALVVEQDPGAVSGLSTAIYLRNQGAKKLGDYVFVAKEDVKVEIEWVDSAKLRIRHDGKPEQTFVNASQVAGVQIEYAAFPPPFMSFKPPGGAGKE